MNRSVRLFSTTFAWSTFIDSLVWTGLPVLLFDLTKRPEALSILFISASSTSILFSALGGYLSDFGPLARKRIATTGNFLSVLALVLISHELIETSTLTWSILIAIPYFCIRSITDHVENHWFLSVSGDGSAIETTQRLSWITMGKIIGMAVGPWFFIVIGKSALILVASGFVLSALINLAIPALPIIDGVHKPQTPEISTKSFFVEIKENVQLFVLFLSLGGLGFPVVAYFLTRFLAPLSAEEASLFWGTGPIATLVSTTLVSCYLKTGGDRSNVILAGLSFILTALLVIPFTSGYLVLAAATLFSLGNQPMRAALQSVLFQTASNERRGRFLA